MIDEKCTVTGHQPVTGSYWTLDAEAPEIAATAQPGQFVHIRIPGLEQTALRRPFSIFSITGNTLHVLYKTVGKGTAMLATLKPGDTFQAMGPLGNGFPMPPAGEPLLVAGGYGVAPLHFLASRINVKGCVIIGGKSTEDILAAEAFKALGWRVIITTEDGSAGTKGMVTDALQVELNTLQQKGVKAEIYACGSEGMLRAVGERAIKADIKAWLSLDKRMGCGVGACLVCVQKVKKPDGTTCSVRVCRDGPVFEAREIVWE